MTNDEKNNHGELKRFAENKGSLIVFIEPHLKGGKPDQLSSEFFGNKPTGSETCSNTEAEIPGLTALTGSTEALSTTQIAYCTVCRAPFTVTFPPKAD